MFYPRLRSVSAWCHAACLTTMLTLGGGVQAGVFDTVPLNDLPEEEKKAWVEAELRLPAAPKNENLVSFYASEVASNRFFLDPSAISVGDDGVVRFTLVIESPEGVRNISYEGMRCETRERRFYARGRADGSWSPSRNKAWQRVMEESTNRHYAALFHDYFCPGGDLATQAEILRDLKRGGRNPSSSIGRIIYYER